MSTPASPRVPMSPDMSRRRMPRPKDKRRALRDFYGINPNQKDGPVEYNALLDSPDFSVSSYLIKLNEDRDVKHLLKLENQMIREIRILDGERKALVYDNYGKMIAATDTIKHVTTEMQPMTKETFSPILTSIMQLTSDIDAHASTVQAQDEQEEEDPDILLRDWILDGPRRIRALMDADACKVAQEELEDVEKEMHLLDESQRTNLEEELAELIKRLSELMPQSPAEQAQEQQAPA